MTAKKKQPRDETYEVTYFAGVPNYAMGGPTPQKTERLRSSGWDVRDGLLTFYGSGPRFVIPSSQLITIKRVTE